MLFTNIKDFRIQYDETLHLLRTDWSGNKRMQQLRPGLTQIQDLARRLRITHALIELNGLPDISAYDQIWLATHWMPTVLRLPVQQVVIVLRADSVYNNHAIEAIINPLRPFIKFDIQFFSDPVQGLHWLTDSSPRIPSLLAEWTEAYYPPPIGVAGPLAAYLQS